MDQEAQQFRSTEAVNKLRKVQANLTQIEHHMPCFRCEDTGHSPQACKYKEYVCRVCRNRGHLARACKAKGQKTIQNSQTRQAAQESVSAKYIEHEEVTLSMYHLENDEPHPYQVQLKFNGKDIIMEIDTGAATSIISKEMYDDLFPVLELNDPSIKLSTYTGDLIPLAGKVRATVEYKKQVKTLSLVVIQGEGPTLLGRD